MILVSYITNTSTPKICSNFRFIFILIEIHKIDTLNIMVHVLNSVIMLIDLAIVGHPIRLSHVYFTTGIGLAYAVFTGIYFLAGGTNRSVIAIYTTLHYK